MKKVTESIIQISCEVMLFVKKMVKVISLTLTLTLTEVDNKI